MPLESTKFTSARCVVSHGEPKPYLVSEGKRTFVKTDEVCSAAELYVFHLTEHAL